ncbi:MAG: hypothetical protein H6734_10205 [Alphaproteobacteria bacterium]|nr:hypothetical protein [Alphaproteobacteria bacterium]
MHFPRPLALLALVACGSTPPAPTEEPPPPANEAPVVVVPDAQIADSGADVQLTGTATDVDGTVTSLAWTQVEGPPVTLAQDAGTVDLVAPEVEEPTLLVFELTATDDDGATDAGRTTVYVRALPDPVGPTAEAGPPQVVDEQTPVQLTGTASDDGTVVRTTWTVVAGPSVTLQGADTLTPTFTAPAVTTPTTLLVQLEVEDDDGLSSTDATPVVVQPVNALPVVDAGPDQAVLAGASVGLAASASDTDGSIVTLAWTQISGPPVTLDDPASLTPGFTAPSPLVATDIVLELQAVDDEGGAARDQVVISVGAASDGNTPPTVDAGPDQEVPEQAAVTLVGTATDTDGTVASTTWTQVSGPPVVLTDTGALSTGFMAPALARPEVLVFRLEAVDDDGALSASTVAVRVEPVNTAPSVDAGVDRPAVEGTAVTLAGVASDSDGSVVRTAWTQVSGPTVTLDDPSVLAPSFTAPPAVLPVVLVFELEAEDDEGAVASDRVTVTVEPAAAANQPPSVWAGADQRVANAGVVTLVGTAEDPDGTVVAVAWTQVAGPAVTLTGADTLTPGFVAPDVACAVSLVFELEAIDDLGATRTDRVAVTVEGDLATVQTLPFHADLETSQGALLAEGGVWEWGPATGGPARAWDGVNAWATVLAGNYGYDQHAWLCLPAIDRAGAGGAVLSFRMWASHAAGDATRVEALHPEQGWVVLEDVRPAYDRSSPVGWGAVGQVPKYDLVTVGVPDELPDPVRLRVAFHSDGAWLATGSYLDDLRVDLESSDPDGDGVSGVRGEMDTLGTDPFIADTDRDGELDGEEVLAGTDPLDPSDLTGAPVVTAPIAWDFETDAGAFVSEGGIWEHGTPSSGNGLAHSGVNVWGTTLGGNYPHDARSFLYLPDVDLGSLADPTLSFRIWSRIADGDAVSVQIHDPVDGWVVLAPVTPAFTRTDALGQSGFGSIGRDQHYELAGFSLAPWAGQTVRLRLSLHTDGAWVGAGALIDDVSIQDELSDPDADGLPGVLGEWLGFGTDPFLADSDGDGDTDGDEESAGTVSLDPADHSGALPLLPGDRLAFETDDGGCASEGEGWEWGTVGSGPLHGWDGSNGWATNLTGNTSHDHRTSLFLPPVDLTTAVDPVLSMRVWSRHAAGDATYLQAWDPDSRAWVSLTPEQPPYDATGGESLPGWRTLGYRDGYVLAAFRLADFTGEVVRLRLRAAMDGSWLGPGTYIDEIRLDEETADPDGDGLAGILAETALRADPYVADTDGDGVDDGQELADGTLPHHPSDWLGGPVWSVGTRETLTLDDGGLSTLGDLWEYGAPAQGPLAGFSDDRAWATSLTTDHGHDRDEALYLPPIDLSGAVSPSLSMRTWFALNNDAMMLEVWDPVLGWTHLGGVTPAYNTTDVFGYAAWRQPSGRDLWDLVGADLSLYAGQIVYVRVVFRSNDSWLDAGVFLDDLAVEEEGADPDGDGLFGVLDERGTYGTDPFLADTDGDGTDDGAEVTAGTDPLDPASHP